MTNNNNSAKPTRIFVSYSHKDTDRKEQVMTILRALPPGIEIDAWDDKRMLAGDDIDRTIFPEIDRTDLFLALISRNYLASVYCKEEMKSALLQAESRGCRVVPIIVRSTEAWRDYPIGQKLALPTDGKCPEDWKSEDLHWTEVERGLLKILKEFHPQQPEQPRYNTNQHNNIPQESIDIPDEQDYEAGLKKELIKCLSNEKLRPLVQELANDQDKPSAEAAANKLLTMEPLISIRHWTEISATWFQKDLIPHERSMAWDAVRDVHLHLLTRVVEPDWLKEWRNNGHDHDDKRLFIVSLKPRTPNRSAEVLVARVDPKCGMVRFYESAETTAVQAHPGQMNASTFAEMQNPTSEIAVQRVGQYLLAQYRPDDEPPDEMQSEDWEDLNDYIVESPSGRFHYHYLVIPEDDENFGNETTLQMLYEKMPNLPRILLSTKRGSNPLICRQNRLEAVIDTFWDIRKMEFA